MFFKHEMKEQVLELRLFCDIQFLLKSIGSWVLSSQFSQNIYNNDDLPHSHTRPIYGPDPGQVRRNMADHPDFVSSILA